MIRRLAVICVVAGAIAPAPASAAFGVALGPAPQLPAFVPGETTTSTTTLAATVEADEPALLTVQDAGAPVPGHLHQPGGAVLSQPLAVGAQTTAPGATGAAPTDLGAMPLTLVTYASPLAAPDAVAISLTQRIAADEPLRTGRYGASLLFTLTAATP